MAGTAIEVLNDYGWAVFFAFIYLSTVGLFIATLLKDRKGLVKDLEKERQRTEAIAKIVQRSVDSNREISEAMKDLTKAVNEEVNQGAQTMAWIKGREESGGRRR